MNRLWIILGGVVAFVLLNVFAALVGSVFVDHDLGFIVRLAIACGGGVVLGRVGADPWWESR